MDSNNDRAMKSPSSWLVAIANLLDFFTAALTSGYVVAWNVGTLIPGGFYLEGWSIGLVLAVVVTYLLISNRYLGGPIWAHILKTGKRHRRIQAMPARCVTRKD